MSKFCKTTSFAHTAYAKHFVPSYSDMYHEQAPMHCFKKIWLYLDMPNSGVVPSPRAFSSSWYLWSTCSSSTNEHAEAVTSSAACCALIKLSWLTKHRLLSTRQLWYAAYRQQCFCWSSELLYWNTLWGGCSHSDKIVQSRWLYMHVLKLVSTAASSGHQAFHVS